MCSSKPKVRKPPPPPQVTTTVEQDEAVLRQKNRDRRRVRDGRESTILAGNAAAPTGQQKTLLGQ